jgi:hypothetical protein
MGFFMASIWEQKEYCAAILGVKMDMIQYPKKNAAIKDLSNYIILFVTNNYFYNQTIT